MSLAAQASELVLPYRDRILGLLQRPALRSSDAYPILVAVVGFLDPGPVELGQLHKWTMEQESEELSRRAMEAIARAGQGAHWPEQLRALGLTESGSGWELSRLPSYTEAFIIGLLYNKSHEPFAPALAQMIERGQSASVNQVLPILRADRGGETHPRVVEDALVARVSKSHRAETLALEALAAIAPQRFISEYSYRAHAEWPAPKRAAVIPCLRYLTHSVATRRQASDALVPFMQDPVFTIRRAAARAVAEVDAQRLLREATRLSGAAEAEERVFGMEAATWLPDEDAFTRLWSAARCDRELSVRRAADHAWRDRRERRLERAYLQRALEALPDELLSVWQYGQALSEVGDDDTVRLLREAMGAKECAPNKRAWLAWLAEAVDRAWENKERKWEERFT